MVQTPWPSNCGAHGFEILTVPADWHAHGRRAGFLRNQRMVEIVKGFREQGSAVLCAAFLDLCHKQDCTQRHEEQLMPRTPGHFSHGTMHCRAQGLQAGIETIDVLNPSVPPF